MNIRNEKDRLVEDYLRRLARAAEPLPAERRTDLITEVTAHIAESRAAGATSEPAVREMLDRLGDPDEIVGAATDGLLLVDRVPRFRSREVAALLLLPFGGFLFLVGWVLGVVLLWASDRWTSMEKLLGTLVLPFGYLPVLMLGTFSSRSCVMTGAGQLVEDCSGFAFPSWFTVPVVVVLLAAPIVVLVMLVKRAQPGRGK